MPTQIDTAAYPVKELLPILLLDHSTGQKIIWATDAYADRGPGFDKADQIKPEFFTGENPFVLQPRFSKTRQEQQKRARKKAEIMTPSWLCNEMINNLDEEYFGRTHAFNLETEDKSWIANESPIAFDGTLINGKERTWENFVDSTFLEITCGEAPFLVSRYDAVTGEPILPLIRRIGALDRKLRVVNENTRTEQDWLKWAERAVQSTYGYEYLGDSLLIARINVLLTFREYYVERWKHEPDMEVLQRIAYIISWNIWQMDGLKNTVPLVTSCEGDSSEAVPCRIFDWQENKSLLFTDLGKER